MAKNISRRSFLKKAGISAAITAPFLAWLISSYDDSNQNFEYKPKENTWGFVKRDVNTRDYNDNYRDLIPAQKKDYVQIGTESLMKPDSLQKKEFEKVAESIIKESTRPLGWKEIIIRYTCTNLGHVESMRFAKPYKQYLEKAIDFLYEKLPQLKQEIPELVILKPGDNYTNNAKEKAFVGLLSKFFNM